MPRRKTNKSMRVTAPGEFVAHIQERLDALTLSRYALAKAFEERYGGEFTSHDKRLKRLLSGESPPDFLFVMRLCDMLGIEVTLKWKQ